MTPDQIAELKRIARDAMFAAMNTEALGREKLGGWDDLEPGLAEVLERVAAATAEAVAAPLIARIEALEAGLKKTYDIAAGWNAQTDARDFERIKTIARQALGRAALNPEGTP
jgi:hypothetical protein